MAATLPSVPAQSILNGSEKLNGPRPDDDNYNNEPEKRTPPNGGTVEPRAGRIYSTRFCFAPMQKRIGKLVPARRLET